MFRDGPSMHYTVCFPHRASKNPVLQLQPAAHYCCVWFLPDGSMKCQLSRRLSTHQIQHVLVEGRDAEQVMNEAAELMAKKMPSIPRELLAHEESLVTTLHMNVYNVTLDCGAKRECSAAGATADGAYWSAHVQAMKWKHECIVL